MDIKVGNTYTTNGINDVVIVAELENIFLGRMKDTGIYLEYKKDTGECIGALFYSLLREEQFFDMNQTFEGAFVKTRKGTKAVVYGKLSENLWKIFDFVSELCYDVNEKGQEFDDEKSGEDIVGFYENR